VPTVARAVDARRWFKGGVMAYVRAVKQELLEVSDDPLARNGASVNGDRSSRPPER
jgi:nicotinamide mononucleotide (NMN) deamidase PncC